MVWSGKSLWKWKSLIDPFLFPLKHNFLLCTSNFLRFRENRGNQLPACYCDLCDGGKPSPSSTPGSPCGCVPWRSWAQKHGREERGVWVGWLDAEAEGGQAGSLTPTVFITQGCLCKTISTFPWGPNVIPSGSFKWSSPRCEFYQWERGDRKGVFEGRVVERTAHTPSIFPPV